jgi:hypothetical protein
MWKVGDIAPVSVLGVDGYPYGFNLTTEEGKALVSFAYVTRTRAEEAAAQPLFGVIADDFDGLRRSPTCGVQ